MKQPQKVNLPYGTGWIDSGLVINDDNNKKTTYQGRLFDLEYSGSSGAIRVSRARVQIRELQFVNASFWYRLYQPGSKVWRTRRLLLKNEHSSVDEGAVVYISSRQNRLLDDNVFSTIADAALTNGLILSREFINRTLSPAVGVLDQIVNNLE